MEKFKSQVSPTVGVAVIKTSSVLSSLTGDVTVHAKLLPEAVVVSVSHVPPG